MSDLHRPRSERRANRDAPSGKATAGPSLQQRTLYGTLKIPIEVRRIAVLAGPYRNVPSWDADARVSSHNHLYRASITLPKVL